MSLCRGGGLLRRVMAGGVGGGVVLVEVQRYGFQAKARVERIASYLEPSWPD